MVNDVVPKELGELPHESFILHDETLTIGPPLANEADVEKHLRFRGLNLSAIVEIPVEKTLSQEGFMEDGTRILYVFQSERDGVPHLGYQLPGAPVEVPQNYLMQRGDVTVISRENLLTFLKYREAYSLMPDSSEPPPFERLFAYNKDLILRKGDTTGKGNLGRAEIRSPFDSKYPKTYNYASIPHLIIDIESEGPDAGRVTLTDLSSNGTRVEVRPGYKKSR